MNNMPFGPFMPPNNYYDTYYNNINDKIMELEKKINDLTNRIDALERKINNINNNDYNNKSAGIYMI